MNNNKLNSANIIVKKVPFSKNELSGFFSNPKDMLLIKMIREYNVMAVRTIILKILFMSILAFCARIAANVSRLQVVA